MSLSLASLPSYPAPITQCPPAPPSRPFSSQRRGRGAVIPKSQLPTSTSVTTTPVLPEANSLAPHTGASHGEQWSEQKHRAWTTQTRNCRQTDKHQRHRQTDPVPPAPPRPRGQKVWQTQRWQADVGEGEGGDGWGPSRAASRTSPEGLYVGLGKAGQGRLRDCGGAGPAERGSRRGTLRGGWPAVGSPGPAARGGRLAGPTLRPPTPPHSYTSSTPGLGPSTPAPALGQVPEPGLAPGQGTW